jgi:hypothetical protein
LQDEGDFRKSKKGEVADLEVSRGEFKTFERANSKASDVGKAKIGSC